MENQRLCSWIWNDTFIVILRNTITGTFSGLGGGLSSIAGLGEEDEEEIEGGSQKKLTRDKLGSAGSLYNNSSSPFEAEVSY